MTDAKPLSVGVKASYGFGSVAYGVNNGGFDYFLLLFYSQVIGLDSRLVGAAIIVALIIDAVSDPVVGYWSDNLHSRWGRRHPFMLAAALPVALSYFMLWNPPEGLSQSGIFWYLLALAVVIRTSMTFYETPSAALVSELSEDYVERSSLISYRSYFGWTGGNAVTVLMFFFLFPVMATEADNLAIKQQEEVVETAIVDAVGDGAETVGGFDPDRKWFSVSHKKSVAPLWGATLMLIQ